MKCLIFESIGMEKFVPVTDKNKVDHCIKQGLRVKTDANGNPVIIDFEGAKNVTENLTQETKEIYAKIASLDIKEDEPADDKNPERTPADTKTEVFDAVVRPAK